MDLKKGETIVDLKEKVENLISEALRTFARVDWTHELDPQPEGHSKDWNPIYCEGGNPDCEHCKKAEEAIEACKRLAEDVLDLLGQDRPQDALEKAEDAEILESRFGDAPSWRPVVDALEELIDHRYTPCECSEITGRPCGWQGDRDDLILIEVMPRYLRAAHQAAGNPGRYPHNGAQRLWVTESCADNIIEHEGAEWAQIKDICED